MIRGHVRTQAYTHHAYLHPYAYAQRVRPNYLYLCACSTIYLCACSTIYLGVRTTIIRARRVACVRRALIIYTCVHVTCVHYYNRFESLK